MEFTKEAQKLAKKCYEAIPKIAKALGKEWKWEPERYDLVLEGEAIFCVVEEDYGQFSEKVESPKLRKFWLTNGWNHFSVPENQFVPLLHWEEIERILEGFGYKLYVSVSGVEYRLDITSQEELKNWATRLHQVEIYDVRARKHIVKTEAKSCQEAVMLGLLRLWEEMKK